VDQLRNIVNPSAVIQSVEAMTEDQIVNAARQVIAAESKAQWIIGRLAHEWTQRYGKGRTDADFAEMVGLERSQITQRRLVYEAYGDVCDSYHKLSWSHFYAACDWDDAEERLAEAETHGWSVAKMKLEYAAVAAPDEPNDHFEAGANETEAEESGGKRKATGRKAEGDRKENGRKTEGKRKATGTETEQTADSITNEVDSSETEDEPDAPPAPSSGQSSPGQVNPDDQTEPEDGDSDSELCRKACNQLIKHVIPRIGENSLVIDRYMRANNLGSMDTKRLSELQAEIYKHFDQARRRFAK